MRLFIKVKKSFDNNVSFHHHPTPPHPPTPHPPPSMLLPTSNAGFSNEQCSSCTPPATLVGVLVWAPKGGTYPIVWLWLCFCKFLCMQLRGLRHKTKLHSGKKTPLCMSCIKKWSLPQAEHLTCWGSSTDRKWKNRKKAESFKWRQRHCSG